MIQDMNYRPLNNIARITIVTLALFFGNVLQESGRTHTGSTVDMFHFSGRHLVCAFDLRKDLRSDHGLESGLTYELLAAFAREHNCTISVIAGDRDGNYADLLKGGRIDLLAVHQEDAVEGILISDPVNGCSSWAMKAGSEGAMKEINEWIAKYTATDEYKNLKIRFTRGYNPFKKAEKGIRTSTVSPYDDLIRQYAKELGWDWRMLAAVIYQESKFSIGASSHRGARGLMQVMPQNAELYDVDNLTDPEQNLKAGTGHLKKLVEMYSGAGMESGELIKFTLASYNAGFGRIKDCRNLAADHQLDNRKWDNIVKVIPVMREAGIFKGTETIAYVDNVLNIYETICTICPQK